MCYLCKCPNIHFSNFLSLFIANSINGNSSWANLLYIRSYFKQIKNYTVKHTFLQ